MTLYWSDKVDNGGLNNVQICYLQSLGCQKAFSERKCNLGSDNEPDGL